MTLSHAIEAQHDLLQSRAEVHRVEISIGIAMQEDQFEAGVRFEVERSTEWRGQAKRQERRA